MNPTLSTRLLILASALVVAVGLVDAAVGGDWDLVVVFAIAAALHVALLARTGSGRPSVPVRRDLVVWLRERAALGGEPLDAVVDRALAAYKDRHGQAISGGRVQS